MCFAEERKVERLEGLNRTKEVEISTSDFFVVFNSKLAIVSTSDYKTIPTKGIPTIYEEIDNWIQTLSCDQLQHLILGYQQSVEKRFDNLLGIHKIEIQEIRFDRDFPDYIQENQPRNYSDSELFDIEQEEYRNETDRIVSAEKLGYWEPNYEDDD